MREKKTQWKKKTKKRGRLFMFWLSGSRTYCPSCACSSGYTVVPHGSQSKKAPMVHASGICALPHWVGLSQVSIRKLQKWWLWLQRPGYNRHLNSTFPSLCSLGAKPSWRRSRLLANSQHHLARPHEWASWKCDLQSQASFQMTSAIANNSFYAFRYIVN
jgi:hypothetical protein